MQSMILIAKPEVGYMIIDFGYDNGSLRLVGAGLDSNVCFTLTTIYFIAGICQNGLTLYL